jgi:23S rRNA (uridine2552-2'-O)-methyltransferase
VSSARWLERQLNDPYVHEAKRLGYRSRAAFKLREIDDQVRFLRPGGRIVDLGCAPGGWCQVAVQRIRPLETGGHVVGIDITAVEPIAGVTILQQDFMDDEAPDALKAALDGPADAVLSDMAAPATGHTQTDHLRIMALAEAAHDFAREVLKPGGVFVAKVLRGGTERSLLDRLKRDFRTVKHIKPPSSRSDSAEMFVVATGFRGES